ncbi:MAG: hypothetical protein NUV74_04530 [Candidatus Brocadiaceae bacterium]|nr:hypothetical protein [Candidatus Brocadiaceae bacterium]
MDYPASNQEKITNFLYVILKRKWFILAIFIITYFGIIGGTWLAPQSYKATTRIFIHTNPKQEITLFPDLAKSGERDAKVSLASNLVQILTGEEMARDVVSSFQLDKLYYKREYEPESCRDIVWYYIHKAFDVIKSPYTYSKLLLVYVGLISPEPEENYFYSAQQEFLDDWLDVEPASDANVIYLSIWGPEPRLISNIANTMAELLVDRTLAISQKQALVGYGFTVNQFREVEEKYLRSQEDLRRFGEKNNIVSLDDQKKILINNLDRFETKAAENEAELYGAVKKANKIRADLQKENKKIIDSNLTGNNTVVVELKSRLKDLEINLNSMLLEKTEKHIDILKQQAQINETKSKLAKELKNIIHSNTEGINPVHQNLRQALIDLESQKIYYMAKKESLNITISEIKKELALIPQKEAELKRLEILADVYTNLYSTVKDKFEKLLILKANEVNEFGLSIISRADLPDIMPVSWPWWDINTIYLGLPLSFVVAIFACFLIEYWTDTFSNKREVEFNLELPVIGMIRNLKKEKPNGYKRIITNIFKVKNTYS